MPTTTGATLLTYPAAPLRVLVACEYSGAVRDAFRALGHDAMSCDLLDTDVAGPHYKGDVFEIIGDGWDLMVAHPPCTYLTNSGVRWLRERTRAGDAYTARAIDRWPAMIDGALFFRRLLDAPIPRVAVENPTMHGYATSIVGEKATQTVHPWQHGHTQTKATGLWLRGLPPLLETDNVKAETMALPYAERSMIHYASPGVDRWKVRSATFPGIAAAMAAQWGGDARD